MAEAVVSPVVTVVLEKLSSLIGEEIGSFWGLKGELEELKIAVSTIEDVVLDAEQKPSLSSQEKGLVRRLKEILYDAEDLLESVSFEAQQKKEMSKAVRIFSSCSKLPFRFTTAHRVKKIKEAIDSVAKLMSIKVDANHIKNPVLVDRETFSLVHEEIVIGREGDKDEVIKLLLDSNTEDNVSLISIVGLGGLGKTTLAQIVYNDPAVKAYFEKQIWVCVSEEFDVRLIVQKIIESATGQKPEVSQMESLKEALLKQIGGKKYMLMLDDVWHDKSESWEKLKVLLAHGAKGSKIVITTRSKLVGEAAGVCHSHVLGGLALDKSWQLFENIAFKQRQDFKTPEIDQIGKEIVDKCSGVPLAVKTIGALLSTKTYAEWVQFKDQNLLNITQAENGMSQILKLSYDHLPSYLKQCFVYCSLFPKDHVILKERVVRLWIAEGYVQPSNGSQQNLEDAGNEYFMNLLYLSFFQEATKDEFGLIRTVKMHDLMHDLATSIGKLEYFSINENERMITEKARHLSYHKNKIELGELQTISWKVKRVRTFLTPRASQLHSCKTKAVKKLISSYMFLRVLDLYLLGLKEVPRSIGELKHLRYLNLSRNRLQRLPECITRLQYLQTLDLSYNVSLEELPIGLKNLRNLRHLSLDGYNKLSHMPRGIGQLSYLQTLSMFIMNVKKSEYNAEINELKDLFNLRGSLQIMRKTNVRQKIEPEILSNKKFLDSLTIDFGSCTDERGPLVDDEMTLGGILQLSNLKKLKLVRYRGKQRTQDQMISQLSFHFPNLVELSISRSICMNLLDVVHLPHLKFIELSYLADFTSLLPLSRLPSLQTIYISDLTALTNFPSISQHLYLEKIVLQRLTTLTTFPSLSQIPCLKEIKFNRLTALTKFPSVSQLPSLKEVKLTDLTSLTNFPSLHELPSLESLILCGLEALEYLQEEERIAIDSYFDLNPSLPFFPSLKVIELWCMPNLKGWWKQISGRGNDNGGSNILKERSVTAQQSILHFPVLSRLTVKHCPNFTTMPFFPHVETLELKDFNGTLLQHQQEQMKNWVMKHASASTPSSPFSKLKSLRVDKFGDLPVELLKNFTCLKHMDVSNLEETLLSLPEELRSINGTLESLVISYVKTMPDWIAEFTSLRYLTVWESQQTKLPDGLHQLTCLRELNLLFCHELNALPESLIALTSLESLFIYQCPKLEERFKKNGGADWAKIAHIPCVEIRGNIFP